MKKYLKDVFNIINYNFSTILGFEIIYKFVLCLFILPFMIGLANVSISLGNYTHLNETTIVSFFTSPYTIVMSIIALIVITITTLYDYSTLVVVYDYSYHNKNITLGDAFKVGFSKFLNMFKIKNIPVLLFVLFLLPIIYIGICYSILTFFDFNFISNNYISLVVLAFIYFVLLFVSISIIYSIHFMIIENKSFLRSCVSSYKLCKDNRIIDFLYLILSQLFVSLLYVISIVIFSYFILLFKNNLFVDSLFGSILSSVIVIILSILLIIVFVLVNALFIGVVSSLFYKHKNQSREKISAILNTNRFKNVYVYIVIILLIIFGYKLTSMVFTDQMDLNTEYNKKVTLTAHRGYSMMYPENTMRAFKEAYDNHTDWIELDVQQTKDRVLVVSHDNNVKRVSGINKKINKMTYDEIKELDVGSSFSKEFTNEKMPTLDEVLLYFNDKDIKINIEIKPTLSDVDIEKQVVDTINKYEMKDKCAVASLSYPTIYNIKRYDNDIKTIYVMAFAYGFFAQLDYVDIFSIEASSITEDLVEEIHKIDKEVYAWTVDDEDTMNLMLDRGVDSIISDDVKLGRKVLDQYNNINITDIIIDYLKRHYKMV